MANLGIVGLDEVTLTTADLAEARRFLGDFGLIEQPAGADELLFVARDGTGLRICPAGAGESPNFRQAVWGVADEAALQRIATELARDRAVHVEPGLVASTDEDGNALCFRITRRVALDVEPPPINVPGAQAVRGLNRVRDLNEPIVPLTFSHLVLFTQDARRMADFYGSRLGFSVTDQFTGLGVFLRADGNPDHHQLFLIERPPHKGLNHVAFHVRDMNEVFVAGKRFADRGHASAWGPGRHIFGGNVFWYFKSPFGGNIEYDADMDVVDDTWRAREVAPGPNTAAEWTVSYGQAPQPH